jgi:hypothetical protein
VAGCLGRSAGPEKEVRTKEGGSSPRGCPWYGAGRVVTLLPLGPVAARSLKKLGWTERRAISLLGASMSPVMKTFLVYNACIAKKKN